MPINRSHVDTDEAVTCIACGETVSRADAREYDKYGNRWDRDDKSFEFLCKPCYRDCCHLDRVGVEGRLVEMSAGTLDRETFLRKYHEREKAQSESEK